MSRISFFEKFKGYLNKQKAQNFTELPPGIRAGLSKYLTPDEEILLTLRNFRAIYKAPRWLDSNTFFNSWFILTNQRIIIARSSSSFKKFRDIPHHTISRAEYEAGELESRLIIHSPGTVDIIEFLREAKVYCEDLKQKVNEVLDLARKREEYPLVLDTIFCRECGNKIPRQSKFCSECGVRL
jgi:hypothetical protein